MEFNYILIEENNDIKKVKIINRCNDFKTAINLKAIWEENKPFKKYLIYNLKRGIIK